MSDNTLHVAAEEYGRANGTAAASWYEMIVDESSAARILAGIEDGDPAILDTFPGCDLSGQWADEPNGEDVFQMICADADVQAHGDFFTDVLDEYEDAYNTAVESEIARRARYFVEVAS